MKTGSGGLSVVQVNFAYNKGLSDPDALLDRYFTLTGWSDALVRAGAGPVAVVQQFHRDAEITRNGVEYVFRRTGIGAAAAARRPDVVHVNGLTFPARTWRLRRELDRSCALVVQSHADGGFIGRAPALRILGRLARRSADAFLFAADEHAAAWRRAGYIAADQPTYQVMPASSTLSAIDRAAAREISGVDGAPALLWVGRLNANKDPLTVLAAFERALIDLPDARLTMVFNTSEQLNEVRARIDGSPSLRDRVRLAGSVPHDRLAAFFSAADIFVVGSHHEGSGYSLMEAIACGAIPVVTDIPTFRLLTGRGTIGALWRPGDADSCARAVVETASRDRDKERVKLAGHFEAQLSWDAVGRRAVEIYRQVLGARSQALAVIH